MRALGFVVLLIAAATSATADLVYVGAVPTSGADLGPIHTVLAMSEIGFESGCVGAGIGGVTVTGAAACASSVTGGNEVAVSQPVSAATLGLTDFAKLQIIFIPSEPAGATNEITLEFLTLTMWNPADGSLLDAKNLPVPQPYASTDPGAGNVGFGYMLDAAQATNANFVLAAFPNLYVGIAATALGSNGDPEVFAVRMTDISPAVPEPSTFVAGIVALGFLAAYKRTRRQ